MNWLVIRLMKYQLKKAHKQFYKEENGIVKKAIAHMIKTYQNTIMFLEANNK